LSVAYNFDLRRYAKETLARVWQMSDVNRQGFLGPSEFVKALRIIALAQAGSEPSTDALDAALAAG
jgi:hypothetical protein